MREQKRGYGEITPEIDERLDFWGSRSFEKTGLSQVYFWCEDFIRAARCYGVSVGPQVVDRRRLRFAPYCLWITNWILLSTIYFLSRFLKSRSCLHARYPILIFDWMKAVGRVWIMWSIIRYNQVAQINHLLVPLAAEIIHSDTARCLRSTFGGCRPYGQSWIPIMSKLEKRLLRVAWKKR